jgi:hydrogenase expression/formation protein HypE
MPPSAPAFAIVTGDTKVVPRGAADKLFINTTGIGVIDEGHRRRCAARATRATTVIVNGTLGDHGATILAARGDLALEAEIASDCAPLHTLVRAMLGASPDIHCLRDATRGGVATVVNEIAQSSGVCIRLDEARLPVREPWRDCASCWASIRCTWRTKASSWRSFRAKRRLASLAAMRGDPFGSDARDHRRSRRRTRRPRHDGNGARWRADRRHARWRAAAENLLRDGRCTSSRSRKASSMRAPSGRARRA